MVRAIPVFTRTGRALALAGLLVCLASSSGMADSVVRFDTALGTFDVRLYDDDAPVTVQNFLNYVADGDYTDSLFHRLVPGFVLQGGGFAFYPDGDGNDRFWYVPTDPSIVNEFHHSNIRGTIAMAKGETPDSATSQFFVNLSDNSANLDDQNGGFTAFGEVLGQGMDVVDLLAGQDVWNASVIHPAFNQLPLIGYSVDQTLAREHLEMVNTVTLLPAGTLIYGDADYSGYVDRADLEVIAGNWGGTKALWGNGDFDANDIVNLDDVIVVAQNWNRGQPPPQAVPEPAVLVLLGPAGGLILRRWTRRRWARLA